MIEATLLLTSAVATVFFVVVMASFVYAKDMHLPEISRGAVARTPDFKNRLWLGLFIAAALGGPIVCAVVLRSAFEANFWQLAGAAYLAVWAINLVDLLIIDIAIYAWWYPSMMRFDDYEPLHDTMYHVRACVRGVTIIGIPLALVAAGIALAVG